MENYKDLKYKLKHTTRKNSIAVVFGSDFIEIRTPKRTPDRVIKQFLEKHYAQIIKNLEKEKYFARLYEQGEEFLIQGDVYKLNIIESSANNVEVCEGNLNLYVKDDLLDTKIKTISNYYKNLAKLDITRLVKEYSKIMGVSPEKVSFNKAEKRWGSCNYTSKSLNFTIRLAMVDENIQEYIVVHELAHLIEPNHSYKFWAIVEKYIPDYKEIEQDLRKARHKLKLSVN
ncbi:MAG: M48 family metallopeptidase [Proteobacteria bacterium]|nr:M48 family metallopeptidase [Pseudomonadota bacterium]